jgi:hypothetical protein
MRRNRGCGVKAIVIRELGGPEVLRRAAAAHRLVATNVSVGKIALDPTLE